MVAKACGPPLLRFWIREKEPAGGADTEHEGLINKATNNDSKKRKKKCLGSRSDKQRVRLAAK
jgi:hypothetical protein